MRHTPELPTTTASTRREALNTPTRRMRRALRHRATLIAGGAAADVEGAERDFRQHLRANGLFDGDLCLEGSHTLPHAYPIYTGGAGERAAAIIAALREWGIESFGRQGAFQYQPTARVSALEAEAALVHEAPAHRTATGTG